MDTTTPQQSRPSLTVSEAARLARVSADTIRRYADDGTLPHYRTPKNARRFYEADIRAVFHRTAA